MRTVLPPSATRVKDLGRVAASAAVMKVEAAARVNFMVAVWEWFVCFVECCLD